MTELTLKIARPEDLSFLLQLLQRLGIEYFLSKKTKQADVPEDKSEQLKVFEEMEKLRLEFQKYHIPADINISELANEVNAL